MSYSSHLRNIGIFAFIAAVSIVAVDRSAAIWIEAHLLFLRPFLREAMDMIELIIGYNISKYLLGYVLFSVGVLQFLRKKNFNNARPWLFVATTHLGARLITTYLKDFFLRHRPFEFIKNPSISDFFSTSGSSFPSGHATYFFSLYFALMFLFPKYKYLLLILPVLVILQRILVNDHYISDVFAGIIVAYCTALATKKLFKI